MLVSTTEHDRSDQSAGPRRLCIVSGENLSPDEGIRFVVGPDNAIVPDILGKLPGRGLWVGAERSLIETAVKKGRFARAARQSVNASEQLADQVEDLLTKRCVDLVALARRAGEAVAGYEKARSWLISGSGGLLVEASDGATGGRGKMTALANGVSIVNVLSADELGGAFGRERAVHVVLAKGGLADKLRFEAQRLLGFRSAGGEWGDV